MGQRVGGWRSGPSTGPVDETCRRAQVVSLRSSRSGLEVGDRFQCSVFRFQV